MKLFLRKLRNVLLKFLIAFLVISLLSVLIFRWLPVPFTPLMLTRCVEQKMGGKQLILKYNWVSLDKISNNLQLAVVCSEDQNFLGHRGFDFGAIEKAMDFNKSHKAKRGASTISQQTAKNLFLWSGRSWLRKGLEAYFTFLIECCWSKQRIMEVYLNIIEMGDGVYGSEMAAQHFFNKSSKTLLNSEAALLAATLPNPRILIATHPGQYLRSRQEWILQQMGLWGGVLKY